MLTLSTACWHGRPRRRYTCASPADLNLTTTVQNAGGSTLWDASFWWPYIGMFLPPVANASVAWSSNTGGSEQATCSPHPNGFKHGDPVSASTIAAHMVGMAEVGIKLPLSYFNLFELGENVMWPLPPPLPGCTDSSSRPVVPLPPQCWNDSSTFIASANLAGAVLYEQANNTVPTYTCLSCFPFWGCSCLSGTAPLSRWWDSTARHLHTM